MPRVRLALWAAAVLAACGLGLLLIPRGAPEPGPAAVGGPFTLTSDKGTRVKSSDFDGTYRLIYFGYTYCPDVCPTELSRMASVLERLGAKADRIQPLFITVDPERDTPDVLRAYVKHFGPRLVGLTGTPEELKPVLSAFRVYSRKQEQAGSAVGYLMDHSSVLYLMGTEGEFITFFTADDAVEDIAERLAALP